MGWKGIEVPCPVKRAVPQHTEHVIFAPSERVARAGVMVTGCFLHKGRTGTATHSNWAKRAGEGVGGMEKCFHHI